jgi:hypothetical protein
MRKNKAIPILRFWAAMTMSRTAQIDHAEDQEAIQFDAQVSQALLAKTSVAAANLQSAIDDAALHQ